MGADRLTGRRDSALDASWDQYRAAMLRGQYFKAHEFLEIPWRKNRSRRLQIAIWFAAAFVHWSRGKPGSIVLFKRILEDPLTTDLPIREDVRRWFSEAIAEQSVPRWHASQLEQLHDWTFAVEQNASERQPSKPSPGPS